MANFLKCELCSWCWQGEGDAFPCCQYPDDGTPAPCEEEEEIEEEY